MSGMRWLRQGYERHQAGDLAGAADLYRRAARDGRVKADALHGLGLVELQRGQTEAAVEALQRAARLAPKNPALLTNLSHALMTRRRFADAAAVLRQTADLAPEAETLFNLAYAEQAAGEPFAAERDYRRALSLDPGHLPAANNLAGLLQSLGRIDEAVATYRAASAINPNDPEIRINLARALEISGQLPEAADQVSALERAIPHDPRTRLLRARLAHRGGEADVAETCLRPLLDTALPDDLACTVRKELALILDRRGDYAEAFHIASEGNRLRARQAKAQGLDGRGWIRRIVGYRGVFSPERLSQSASISVENREPPVFFVGFPRSGTTLMETILATHEGLVTSGEITPLDHVLSSLAPGGSSDAVLEALAGLDEARIAELRGIFWTAAEALFPGRLNGRRLVDKAPFNLVELGLINLLFPNAPVIVAVRDPRDVCLSCFFQDFTLSDAVVNFLDISDAASAYAAVDALWRHYQECLTLPWMEYRYEDLVADPATQAAAVFQFLGLDWDPAQLVRRGQPGSGQFIATPSRDAVAQPITAAAVQRWRRYEQELAPALAILDPVIKRMGYDGQP